MSFLRGFNFVRAVILLSLIGSGVLAWFAWKQNEELRAMREALQPGGYVEKTVTLIQEDSLVHSQLKRQRDADGLSGQSNPESYIRRIAGKDRINLGQVEIRPGQGSNTSRETKDETYTIVPKNDRGFDRTTIGNFLYKLEEESPQVRLTEIRIQTRDKTKPEEIPEDRWTFECTLTSRTSRE